MSKHAAGNSPSTPKSKRRKLDGGQTRLDTFFGSPARIRTTSPPPRTPQKKKIAASKDPDIIDVDLLDDHEEDSAPRSSVSLATNSPSATVTLQPVKFIQSRDSSYIESSTTHYASLAVDPVSFNPQTVITSHSTDTPYSFLAHALSTISATRSRIAILDTLTNTFRTILLHHPPSLLPSIYLLSNTLSPAYSNTELNIGPSVISQAIQHVSGLSSASLKTLYSRSGDPGDVAFAAKSNTRTLVPHPALLVSFVYNSFLKIATCKGQGATKEKQKIIEKLLVSAKGEEIRFLVRTLSQNLRVGAVRTSVLTALARSVVLTPPTAQRDSTLCASPELLSSVKPLVAGSKKKKTMDSARDNVEILLRSAETLLRRVFVQHPNYAHIVEALLDGGLDELADRVPLTVGIPLYPALGTPIRTFEEISERLNDMPFTAELKYDGQRAQIHGSRRADGRIDVRMFSRHLEDMTSKYPDITALLHLIFETHPETQSFIIDAEIVAVDPVNGSLKSFQALSNRARKDVRLEDVEVPVGVFAFDLMYLDGEVLLERSFRARRSLLRSRFPPIVPENKLLSRLQHVESCESSDGQSQMELFWKAVVSRHDSEGLMIKLLDDEVCDAGLNEGSRARRKKTLSAIYDADKRTFSWMKLKKDYVSGLGDSLDLIPIGAWYGNGRKAGWWSPILLAIWDPERGIPVAVCKCMSGFTDAFYKTLSEVHSLDDADNCSKTNRWDCETGGLKPDVYFKPQAVWEIRGADVTLSPVSIAARELTSSSKGLSLRFPRFIRVREDKAIAQASDPSFLAGIWRSQQGQPVEEKVDSDDLIDIDFDSTGEYSETEDFDL